MFSESQNAIAAINAFGFDKLVCKMASMQGFPTENLDSLEAAVRLIGTKYYYKQAEYQTIFKGLEALGRF